MGTIIAKTISVILVGFIWFIFLFIKDKQNEDKE